MKRIHIAVGIPGSGKSTKINDLVSIHKELNISDKSYIVLNADSVRKELYGDENIQGSGKEVFDLLYKRLKIACEDENIKFIYIDNTSVNISSRNKLYEIIDKYCDDYRIYTLLFSNFDKAYEQNRNRERVVPEHVLDRMKANFDYPTEIDNKYVYHTSYYD